MLYFCECLKPENIDAETLMYVSTAVVKTTASQMMACYFCLDQTDQTLQWWIAALYCFSILTVLLYF